MKFLLNIIFCFPFALFSQSIFNDLHDLSAEEDILTSNQKVNERANYKIKKIVRTKILSQNFQDSLIKLDPKKHFVENHTSTLEVLEYNRSGLLTSHVISPLNVPLTKKEIEEHRSIKIKNDTVNGEYVVDHFYNNNHTQSDVYMNGLWTRSVLYDQRFQLGYLDENNKPRDTLFICDSYIQLKYNNNKQIVYREYMNTEYYGSKGPCSSIEYENYEYKKNKISAVKIPFQKDPNDNKKYLNEITLNKAGQIVRSEFYTNSLEDVSFIYILKYDKHNNIETIYEALDPKDPGIKVLEYANYYDNSDSLVLKIDVSPQSTTEYYQKIFYYNKYKFLSKLEYCSDDWRVTETFDYEFY